MKKAYSIDMTQGPILNKIFVYAVPLILSGLLQLFFNAADIIVVGRFSGPTALAAVGSTGALIHMLINLFMGLSIGTNVLVARYIGAKQDKDVEETVHTSIKIALVGGFFMIFIGLLFSRPLLELMRTPNDVIDQSVLYMQIYFLCMPAFMVYNFGAAILRAIGDTKRPLYYLLFAGVLNVILNMIFVIVFKMGVAGVAWATSIAQVVSAILVVNTLRKSEGSIQLKVHNLKISTEKAILMLKIGIPAGLQGIVFSLSNVLIQSTVNSFGSLAMAGNTAASNIEGFVYISMNAIYQTSLSFVSQNLGAKNLKRIKTVSFYCIGLVSVVGFMFGATAFTFGEFFLSFYTTDVKVVEFGMMRLSIFGLTHFIGGVMDVLCGIIRGLGKSVEPMIFSLIGVCGFRVFWIFVIFPLSPSLYTLYLSYPITWVITGFAHTIFLNYTYKRIKKEFALAIE